MYGLDTESNIPEEDIINLERLFNEPQSLENALKILVDISFLPAVDIDVINQTRSFSALNNNDQLSKATAQLISCITVQKPVPITAVVKERIVYNDGWRHDWRSAIQVGNYDLHLLIEKDPGEVNILDHEILNISRQEKDYKWLIGDHQLIGGYGLITWRSTPVYKGFESVTVLPRVGKGLKPYRSSNEYWATRGLAAEWATAFGTATLSLGRTYRDGKVENGQIQIDVTGAHLTEGDVALTNNLLEETVTLIWYKPIANQQIGVIANSQRLTDKQSNQMKNNALSLFFYGQQHQWRWFGEWALNNHEMTALSGVSFYSKKIKYLCSIRQYPHAFRVYRTQPFSEWQSQRQGERGLFQNMQWRIAKHTIAVFSDIAQKNDQETLVPHTKINYETGFRWRWTDAKHRFQLQIKGQTQSTDNPVFIPENNPVTNHHTTYKLQYTYPLTNHMDIYWQLNSTVYNDNNERSIGMETKIATHYDHVSMTISWIMAAVDSHAGRLYFWALNLPGEMSSIMINKPSQHLALRMYLTNFAQYNIYFRLRLKWPSLNFASTAAITGAFALQVNI